MVAVAILMTILGTRLTGVSPRLAAWSPTLPPSLGRGLGLDGGRITGYSDGRAAALGAASFFLPCGFTQAVQVYALSTGSPVIAGATMAAFALGTAPGLLALAGLPSLVPTAARPTLLRLVGVVVLGFAVVNATGGLRLAGVSLPLGTATVAAAPAGDPTAEVQFLHTFQGADGYFPANASIYAGRPTRWIVESLDSNSCATFLRVPGLGIAATLQKGENVIELPALRPGSVPYTCSMGMYGGVLTVVAEPAGSLDGASGGG